MRTKELIERFDKCGFQTKKRVDTDDKTTSFVLEVYERGDLMVEIFDNIYGTNCSISEEISVLKGKEIRDIIKILYELVISED